MHDERVEKVTRWIPVRRRRVDFPFLDPQQEFDEFINPNLSTRTNYRQVELTDYGSMGRGFKSLRAHQSVSAN